MYDANRIQIAIFLIYILFNPRVTFCYGYVCTQFVISGIYRKNRFADSDHSFRGNISEARLRGPRRIGEVKGEKRAQ